MVCTYVNDQQLECDPDQQGVDQAEHSARGRRVLDHRPRWLHELGHHSRCRRFDLRLRPGVRRLLRHETAAPTGYSIDDSSAHTVTVDNNTDCSGTPETFSATDTPLTNIAASAHSQAAGGTQSTVTCVDSEDTNIGNSPQGLSESPAVAANGLAPGTYTCTVVIDP